jgi:translation initiation factor 1A
MIREKIRQLSGFRRKSERGVDGLTERPPQKGPGGETGNGEILRVRLPQKRNREMFRIAELMMGANHIRVRGLDGVTRLGRIKGKIKKKVWIREGDILVIVPWPFQDEKCPCFGHMGWSDHYQRVEKGRWETDQSVSTTMSYSLMTMFWIFDIQQSRAWASSGSPEQVIPRLFGLVR